MLLNQEENLKTILFIDQDEVQLHFLIPFLEQKNFKVITRSDGLEGISAGLEKKPDIIFVSYTMRDLKGIAICRIFKFLPETQHIPVIFLCSAADPISDQNIQESFGAYGAAGIFFKPISTTKLLAKIKNYI